MFMPNRLKLIDELQRLIDTAESSDRDTAVVLLDLERFSFLNETMGYDPGTELLNAFGKRLVQFSEDLDREQKGIVGRFGADEFACLISGIDGNETLDAVPPQLLSSIGDNPNALLSPEASESLLSKFAETGDAGRELGERVLEAIRESLANAVGDIFFLAFIFVLISVVAAVFIREIPLKGRAGMRGNAPPDPAPGATSTSAPADD